MSKRDTGGPAFPPHPNAEHPGMTLRDYFAAKAMVAFWLDPEVEEAMRDTDDVARYAYEMADAMLKARQK